MPAIITALQHRTGYPSCFCKARKRIKKYEDWSKGMEKKYRNTSATIRYDMRSTRKASKYPHVYY